MFKYFQTNNKKVKYNDTLLENAEVVACLSTAIGIPIPTEYLGVDIVGMLYDPTTNAFYECEEVVEEQEVTEEIDWDSLAEAITEGVNDVE